MAAQTIPPLTPARCTLQTMSQMNLAEPEPWLWHKGGARTPWDGLRKDADLWQPHGDCLIYLYAEGASKRPASFQIPLELLYAAKCTSLLASWAAPRCSMQQHIFIGAPKDLNRQDTLRWHITTRNFFAWLMGKPLVGHQLGVALSDLLERMQEYREPDCISVDDLLAYMDQLGYSQLTHRSDMAVALLVLAERQRMRDQWLNAFSHCVGMSEGIEATPEYEVLSETNRALITKAALQMDIDLEAKIRSVAALLEDELTYKKLEIPIHTLSHLDHFRAFLQSHLSITYRLWPPHKGSSPRSLYFSLQHEFDCLLRYIGNLTTTAADGKDHVLTRFDAKHDYRALNISRALLPHLPSNLSHDQTSTGTFPSLTWRKAPKSLSVARVRAEHIAATNQKDPQVLQSPLVQAFARFEEENAAAIHIDISYKDARRTCFLLVYCMLQTLSSITRAAPEVTESQEVAYPLCCNTSGLPLWSKLDTRSVRVPSVVLQSGSEDSKMMRNTALGRFQNFSIDPDLSAGGSRSTSYHTSRSNSTSHVAKIGVVLRTHSMNPMRKGIRRTLGLTRPSSPARSIPADSKALHEPEKKTIKRLQEPTSPSDTMSEDGTATSDSDVPSLYWSRKSSKSISSGADSNGRPSVVLDPRYSPTSSTSRSSYSISPNAFDYTDVSKHADLKRSLSRSSSVYSERIVVVPEKPALTSDVLDKGLAEDGTFVIPGLF